jgi:hypothetical protein
MAFLLFLMLKGQPSGVNYVPKQLLNLRGAKGFTRQNQPRDRAPGEPLQTVR